MRLILLIFLSLTLGVFSAARAQDGTRIFISVDMEGLAGAYSGQQVGGDGRDYQRFRGFMTEEVNAAIEGARAAGATEFVIADAHGNKQNLLIDQLPDDVRLVGGSPRPYSMMQGIEDGHFDGVIFIGYHGSATNPDGLMAHTMTGFFEEININGVSASEGLLNAMLAGYYDVPVIMISGDDRAGEEVSSTVGDMEIANVKTSLSRNVANSMTPQAAQRLIREKAEAAVRRIDDFTPYKTEAPIVLNLTFNNYRRAEITGWLPGVERTGLRSIRYQADDFLDIQHFIRFLVSYPG